MYVYFMYVYMFFKVYMGHGKDFSDMTSKAQQQKQMLRSRTTFKTKQLPRRKKKNQQNERENILANYILIRG